MSRWVKCRERPSKSAIDCNLVPSSRPKIACRRSDGSSRGFVISISSVLFPERKTCASLERARPEIAQHHVKV